MKTPKDYLAEMEMDDDILFNRHEVSVWLSDFIKEIQKDAYNQAIQDAVDSVRVKAFHTNTHIYWNTDNIDKDSILKLKIK